VCRDLGAQLLIDDCAENALSCAISPDPVRVLLFGDWEWNKRISSPADHRDDMAFAVRLEREKGRDFWKDEIVEIPDGAPLWRVKDWGEVVSWIVEARRGGVIL
jgi:hypothetical protein